MFVTSRGAAANQFRVAVQPRSRDGVIRTRGKHIGKLLTRCSQASEELVGSIADNSLSDDDVSLSLKSLLENYRSALEYTAHYLAAKCDPVPAKHRVQFPIALSSDDESSFSKKMEKWFPSLSRRAPAVYEYLLSVQPFRNEIAFQLLATLTNETKHNALLELERRNFKQILLGYNDALIRIGDLGFNSFELGAGGAIEFFDSGGRKARLIGPISLARNIELASHIVDSGLVEIRIVNAERPAIRGSDYSLPDTICIIGKNVNRAVNDICSHIQH